ncbi:MAG: hypothetical protein ACRC7V_10055 [Lachnospiraceae bacterium]
MKIIIVIIGISFLYVYALAKSAGMADQRMEEIMAHQNIALGGETDVG